MSGAGWKDIKYKQELPPPGGYGSIPYKRNLPVRGPSGAALFGIFFGVHGLAYWLFHYKKNLNDLVREENGQAENCLRPLLDAEKDRAILRDWKENIESEALNIVGTGFDPDHKPGMTDEVYHDWKFEQPLMEGGTSLFPNIRHWYNSAGVSRCGP